MWIKICGIRDVRTAREVAELGPSAIGLNFYQYTPRSVPIETAVEIVESLPETVTPVGLFVNHTLDEIIAICRRCGLRTIQLHGEEPPSLLVELRERIEGIEIIRAHRVGPEGVLPLGGYLDSCRRLGVPLAGCLLDARSEGQYGGTGATLAWQDLSEQYQFDRWPPLVLAGGLTSDNVSEAIQTVRPWGVDVASGVESAPGEKDFALVRRFIEQARQAACTIGSYKERTS